jgi:hypothetical protein
MKTIPTIIVIGPRDKLPSKDVGYINTTSRSPTWSQGLSPFFLGPVSCYSGLVAQNVENAWQYSKVYPSHVDADGNPSQAWEQWRNEGFARFRADRYPMGKGAVPLYSWWDGKKLSYIEARQEIYIPIYAAAVRETQAFKWLEKHYNLLCDEHLSLSDDDHLYLWDFDGYDHRKLGMSYSDVVLCESRKMGHAFVLAMMLEGLI